MADLECEETMGDPHNVYGNCTPEDFLWIASVIRSTVRDISISDLANCLGISFDGRDETGDQIIQESFLLWQSKNGADRSREKLLQCLEQLQGASAFMEKLRERYISIGRPRESQGADESNETSGIIIHLQDANIPTAHGGDSVTPPPSSEVESDVIFPSPVPIKEAVGKTSKMLVHGQLCTDIRSAPELFTKPEVTQKIAEMEEKFSALVSDVQLHFQSFPEEKIQAMKSYLASLSMSVREDVSECVFTSQQVEIITYNKLPQIFQWLTINGIWSFLNTYLLEKLVDTYSNSDDLKQRVATFKEEMQHFKRDMKLADFLPAWSGRCPHIPASGFAPIILRVNKDWGDCTLGDVADMEGFLESRFLINRFILRFANGHYGSVVIMWLVPAHAIAYLKKRILAIGTVSLITNQVKVKFGDNFTVKASSISIQEPNPCTVPIKSRKSQEQISKALLDCGNYDELYATSIKDADFFWGTLAKQFLQWDEPFEKVEDCNMEEGEIKWFTGGKLNVSVNCVDRHAKEDPDRVALIWEKDEPDQAEQVTYKELLQKVCQIANVLKSKGVKKGDTVAIYMPACPLAVASMLACTRIGAVHSVLFSKFALVQEDQRAKILKERTAGAKVIITANTSLLNGKVLPLKESLEILLESSDNIQHVLVYKRTDAEATMKPGRDEWLEEKMEEHPTECEPESMDSEDDLFVMFTSGVAKIPKGIVHSQAGYLLHVAVTFKYYFDYQPGEIFACMADIGWITGHSYVVYGPLCNGATTVLYDSTALYPSASRFWEVVERLKINHFYTTPSVIQKLRSLDKDIPNSFDLSSLRVIASVGECLNKEAWSWFHKRFGDCRCHFIDTWWQTELGGIAIAPHPKLAVQELKPGFIMKPSFGVIPRLIDEKVKQKGNEATGKLYLEAPLPGMGRRLTGDEDQEMFKKEYFTANKRDGKTLYYTSDVAHRDKDGDYQIYSRANDAIRYHGELLNLPIIEGAANVSHESIEETVLVLDLGNIKENATTLDEPNVIAHVQLKDALSPNTEEDVMFSVQESIEQTSRIEKKNLQVKIHQEDKFICSRKTFSGKTKRQALRNNPDSDAEYDPFEGEVQTLNQGYHHPVAPTAVFAQ